MGLQNILYRLAALRKKLPIWPVFVFEFIAGVVLIGASNYLRIGWDFGVLHDLGIALLVASILSATIEVWMRKAFARDVFEAALGYILPPVFRDEVRRITGYKFICERHSLIVEIEAIENENDVCKVTSMVERRLRNITSDPQQVRNLLHIDEWQFEQGDSQILECKIIPESGESKSISIVERIDSTVKAVTDEVTIFPNQTATLYSKWLEYRRTNDSIHVSFQAPTINPEIEVRKPNTLSYFCSFGASGDKVEKHQYANRQTLVGTYFPLQFMWIRWWPTKTAD